MIVSENITTYLHSLDQDGPSWLEKLREKAVSEGVPVIRREMESFLRVLLQIKQPAGILEIGTGVGYSALFMQNCLPEVPIVTIENYEERLVQARKNFAGRDTVTLLEGDAAVLLKTLPGPFDLIFLDAAKGQYITMLPEIKRLLSEGGLLLADNVLLDGELVRSRYYLPRRQRTIHTRMREFIWEVKHDPDLASTLLTVGDGVILSIKKTQTR